MTEIEQLQAKLRVFRDERNWRKFLTPKNLVMALAAECGELVEIFQWLTPDESKRPPREAVRDEMADVFIYLVQLADVLSIDLIVAAHAKIEKNARKYPGGNDD